jgi:hypothetical protein
VIIVGYGPTAQPLRRAGILYVILDEHGLVVAARLNEPIFFGDGTRAEVLDRVGLKRARVIVFAIASVGDERRAVVVARHHNPTVHIVTRTRYVSEITELQRLGANEVVPEEFETSLEIFARVLRRFDIPASRIREAADEARRDHRCCASAEPSSRRGARASGAARPRVVVARAGRTIGHGARAEAAIAHGRHRRAVLRHGEGLPAISDIVIEDGGCGAGRRFARPR